MSVYSELVNESGFDPGAPGPSAVFVDWGYENDRWWLDATFSIRNLDGIPVAFDPTVFLPEVNSEDSEA